MKGKLYFSHSSNLSHSSYSPPAPASLNRTLIGIAVVEHAGNYLVGIRADDGPLPGYAEFPGGKCRPGETPAACAIRECAEETGLRVDIAQHLLQCDYDYPHGQVDLHFFLCRPSDAASVQDRHAAFEWVPASRLRDLKFPPANQPVIDRLTDRLGPTNLA